MKSALKVPGKFGWPWIENPDFPQSPRQPCGSSVSPAKHYLPGLKTWTVLFHFAFSLSFDQQSVRATEIREGNTYGGVRIKMLSHLDNARIPVQVDIGLGDAVYPEPDWVEFSTLLDLPSPRIRAYPMETVVAEKLQAIVELGMENQGFSAGCQWGEVVDRSVHLPT